MVAADTTPALPPETPAAPSYADAVLVDRWRVAGLRLAVISLGHVLLLERLGSPLLTGAALGAGDAALAIDILRRPWRQAAERVRLNRGRLFRSVLAWHFRDTGPLVEAETGLRGALAEALERPDTLTCTKDDRQLRQPWILALHIRLVADFGLGLDEALDIPMRQATWLSTGMAERDGAVEWVDDGTRAVMNAMRRQAGARNSAPPAAREDNGGVCG